MILVKKISNSKQFVKIATGGRHRGLNTVYIKHNLFHQSKLGRDVELQNTHIVLFKSPRDVLQINTLSQQLGLGSQLKEWYQDATSVPYVHLLIDLTPKKFDLLSYCSKNGSVPTKFHLPAGIETKFLDNEYSILPVFQKFSLRLQKKFILNCPKDFIRFLSEVFCKPIKRRASRSSEKRRSKISKRNFRTHTKRTLLHKRRKFLSSFKVLQLYLSSPFLSLNY